MPARAKRAGLTLLGRRVARRTAAHGFPGCEWLLGITDPSRTADVGYWAGWLKHIPLSGNLELCCHPGYLDLKLIGRDCEAGDGLKRRSWEMNLLRSPSLPAALERAGLRVVRPSEVC